MFPSALSRWLRFYFLFNKFNTYWCFTVKTLATLKCLTRLSVFSSQFALEAVFFHEVNVPALTQMWQVMITGCWVMEECFLYEGMSAASCVCSFCLSFRETQRRKKMFFLFFDILFSIFWSLSFVCFVSAM